MKKINSLLLLFITSCSVSAQVDGNINLKKGEKFTVESKTVTVTSMSMMGQSMETNINAGSVSDLEVKNIQDSGYNLTSNITKMKFSFSGMGQSKEFDSDKKEDMNGEMGSNFKNVINVPQDVLMDKTGKIIAQRTGKTDTATDTPDPMKQMMQQFMGDPAETGYGATAAFINIPKKPAVGFTWTDSSSAGGMIRSTTYTISKIEVSQVNIAINGTVKIEMKTEMQGMEVIAKSSGILKGNEIANLTTGVIQQMNSTLESAGTVQVMGQEVPTTTKVTTNIMVLPVH